ncbi:cytochrome-c peroxidase [Vitiosangium sp. GDMCC 1.1324]|uniref:cytochrome-c peroxidase n=1 Tax=Vitiosangium sp. (strain GDMCC 1.1324) TaxID=2138576 RepID=UPI000D35F4A1|nr:cytochrome c peroxidase [Vitiosangium sp. GDMCC 1.1324]PTL76659.1 cytochrome-c peroxidase [Vitiosangium sp. GDMCC 1.1324]
MSRHPLRTWTLAGALVGALGLSCTPEEPFPNLDELELLQSLHTPTHAPPKDPTNKYGDNPAAAALGLKLFKDPGLSSCGNISCQSCHDGEGRTVDTPKATGCGDQLTGRNPPSVINSGYSTWFMWDGRADRLWNQALLPLLSPVEMASSPAILRARLDAAYKEDYRALFGKAPLDETDDNQLLANFGKVIAAYERTLNRTEAPFDQDVIRFLAAVDAGKAEDDPAYLGLKTFVRKGQCSACHKGPMLSDDQFHNIGVKDLSDNHRGVAAAATPMLDWPFNSAGPYSDAPSGTESARLQRLSNDLKEKAAELEGAYKTPTLRNIELTAPYMHTGELKTLEDVIELYNKGGEPAGNYAGHVSETIKKLDLSDEEKKALVKLLKSMTGAAK